MDYPVNNTYPTPEEILEAVEAINAVDQALDPYTKVYKPSEVFTPQKEVVIQAPSPKPVARPKKDGYVTNTAFRDHEGLRNLQRDLHRAKHKNSKGTK